MSVSGIKLINGPRVIFKKCNIALLFGFIDRLIACRPGRLIYCLSPKESPNLNIPFS
ncbi:MAG: hypothetical protein BWY32_02837 [bacterium ADurb.Bin243]|nr:MAG: hypothetical protein BWY32_02837 [bacterium ADurb.Bin243]